jgi:endonuclease-3
LLTRAYGSRVWSADNYISDIVGALVATILSQNTSDINSGRAYLCLREAFPGGWDDVRTAPVEQVVDAIRAGGLANIKASRIQAVLEAVHERFGATTSKRYARGPMTQYGASCGPFRAWGRRLPLAC